MSEKLKKKDIDLRDYYTEMQGLFEKLEDSDEIGTITMSQLREIVEKIGFNVDTKALIGLAKLVTGDESLITLDEAKHVLYIIRRANIGTQEEAGLNSGEIAFYLADADHIEALNEEELIHYLGQIGVKLSAKEFEMVWGLNYGRPLTKEMIAEVLNRLYDLDLVLKPE